MSGNSNNQTLTGADRAAILMHSMSQENFTTLMRQMGQREVQRITAAMARNKNIKRPQLEVVIKDFFSRIQDLTSVGSESSEQMRDMLVSALGEERANEVLDMIVTGGEYAGLENIKFVDAHGIADIIRMENPQTIATIIAYVEPELRGEVLHYLPQDVANEAVVRLARIDGVQPNALKELNEVLEKQFSGQMAGSGSVQRVGGAKSAAEALNRLENSRALDIIEHIQGIDEELAADIQDQMFVFDDLVHVDDKNMQALISHLERDTMVLALKGCDEEVRQHFFSSMSNRARTMLEQDMESKGAVRLSDAEGAQREILKIAQRLDNEGEIILGSDAEQVVS